MPDLKKILTLALGMTMAMAAGALAQGVPGGSLPTPASYGDLFGTQTGDAYSSILLNQMFGPLFPSATAAEGSEGVRTVFSSIIGYFNVIILVVGGLMFFYNVTVGVLQSAHEGQVLGQRWSSLWAPIRVLFAVGLLVPVPNYGGYNLAQVGVAYVVKGSTNIASEVWKSSVDLILDGDIPIATSEPRFNPEHIRTLYENAACMNLLNYQYRTIKSPKIVDYQVTYTPFEDRSNIGLLSASFPRYRGLTNVDNMAGICGAWYTPDVPAYLLRLLDETEGAERAAAQAIVERFAEGHRDIMVNVETAVRALATGDSAAKPVRQDIFETTLQPLPFTNQLIAISETANSELKALTDELRASAQATSGKSAYANLRSRITGNCTEGSSGPTSSKGCYGEGWIGAGAYYTTLARVNAEINSLVTAQPKVLGRTFGTLTTQEQFVDNAGGGGWFWGRNASGQLLPSDEEAQRILTRYMELFSTSSAPLAALGYQMSTTDIISANAEAGDSTSGLLDRFLSAVNEEIQIAQAGLIRYFDPAAAGQDPMIGLISTGGFLIGIGGAILFVSIFSTTVAVIAVPFFSILLAAGATLSFVLPMMPFFYWILGVTGYFLLVVEAIVAVNLWALAHMRMDGDGISGQAGQKGWLMLLALLMTPVLMVFGFLIGMGIFRISSNLISAGMFYAVSGISGGSNILVALVGIIAFSIMIVTAYIFILERSFSLISEFPNRVMMWMGEGIQIGGGEDRIRAAAAGAAVGINSAGNHVEGSFKMGKNGDGSRSLSTMQGGVRSGFHKIRTAFGGNTASEGKSDPEK
jgi:conjugal transfer/type IV secretion protein DotA/TraY